MLVGIGWIEALKYGLKFGNEHERRISVTVNEDFVIYPTLLWISEPSV